MIFQLHADYSNNISLTNNINIKNSEITTFKILSHHRRMQVFKF